MDSRSALPHDDERRDEAARRIDELIVGVCVATQPVAALLCARAELCDLAEQTGDGCAADAASGAVAEIDAAVADRTSQGADDAARARAS